LKLRLKIHREIAKAFLSVSCICVLILIPWQTRKATVMNQKLIALMQTFITRDISPLANAIFEERIRSINIRAKNILEIEGVESVYIFDAKYRLLSDISTKPQWIQGDLHFQTAAKHNLDAWTTRNSLWYLQAIPVFDETIGYILIEYSLADMEKNENLSLLLFTGTIVMFTLILLLLTNRLIRNIILRPVDHLIQNMTEIEKGHYGRQISNISEDEIGELAGKFNSMSMEIDTSYQQIENRNKQLKQTKNLLDSIINSMPSILITIDDQGRIKEWNTRAERAAGISLSSAKGKPLNEIFPMIEKHMDDISSALTDKATRKLTKVEAMIKNRLHYLDMIVYPVVTETVEGAVIIIDDRTDIVYMEEMMIQNEKMLSVGGLAAGMAHEINNPLAGIMQTANVLKNRLTETTGIPANIKAAEEAGTTMESIQNYMESRKIPHMLGVINESGKRVAEIVSNMLSFARKSDATAVPHSLSGLLDKTLELASTDYDLKKEYDFKAIRIRKEYEDNLPEVPCEEGKIKQVIFNILRNGAQAMQEGGTEIPRFTLRTQYEKEKKMVRMEIEDNGPGMDEEDRKRVFEPFFTTKPVGKGTGLGLSISYFIITENHGGEMSVESRPGSGAKFIIRLPVKGSGSPHKPGAQQ
jgi:PAS domain S-box-containing protein